MTRYNPEVNDPKYGPMDTQPDSAKEDSTDDGPQATGCTDCGRLFLSPEDTGYCQGCRE